MQEMRGGRRQRQGSGAQPRALPGQPIILLVCCAVAALAAVLALGGWGWEGDAAADPAVAALVQRAHAADRAGRKAEALGLWRQVLRISPTDLDANRALGFYMVYREKLEEAAKRAAQPSKLVKQESYHDRHKEAKGPKTQSAPAEP